MAGIDLNTAELVRSIVGALELSERNMPLNALALLEGFEPSPLPDRPEWIARQLEIRASDRARGISLEAALDWVALARERLQREADGEELLGSVPVRLCLRSALHCLGYSLEARPSGRAK